MTNQRFARLTTTSVTAAALLMGAAFAQDDCATATPISAVGSYAWDNTGFTNSNIVLGAPCLTTDGVVNGAPENDYWFEWTVPAAGDYQLTTIGTGFDTVLQVLLGPCGSEVCVAADDDSGSPLPVGESLIDLPGQAGTEVYFLHVGQWSNNGQPTGAGILNILDTPANDTCATPDTTTFVGTGTFPWSNLGASSTDFDGGGLPCLTFAGNAAPRLDVFFTWSAPSAGAFSFDTGGTGTDTVLHIHDGVDCAATCIAFDDDGLNSFPVFPGESRAVIPGLAMGDSLLIQIGLWNGNPATGAGFMNINVVMPPANDTCAAPIAVTTGSIPYDNSITTSSNFTGALGGAPAVGSGDDPGADLFYVFNAPNNANYQIDTLGTAEDTVLNLYLGADCTATYLQNSQDEGTAQSRVFIVNGTAGQDYLIQAGGWQGATTVAGILNVTELPAPGPGNECSTAIAVGLGATAFDNTNMTTEGFGDGGGGACPTGFEFLQPKQDMFFQFTAPAAGDYQFDTLGSGADTIMTLHVGTGCVATCVEFSDDNLPVTGESRDILTGLAMGDQILVQIGGWGHIDIPTGVLNVSSAPAPTNDTCATPEAIAGEGAFQMDLFHPSITSSGFDGGDPVNCPVGIPNNGIGDGIEGELFFVWTADCDGDYQFSTDPTTGAVDTVLAIHAGSDCNATCVASNDDIIPGAGGNFLSAVIVNGIVAGDQFLVQVGMADEILLAGFAQLTVTNLSGPCPVGGILEVGCTPASPHQGGIAATMVTSTFSIGQTPSGLQIQVTDGSPGEFGFILMSADHTDSLAIFNGILCLNAPQGRYNPGIATNQGLPQLNSIGQFDAGGVLQNVVGTAPSTGGSGFDVPVEQPFSPVGMVIAPGDVFAFQCWYRDGASANFSDSIKVQF